MTLTVNEEVTQFKNDMNSYLFRKKKINELQNKLISLENRMVAVSSPKMDNRSGSSSKQSDFRLALIEKKGYLQDEIKAYKAINYRVESLINSIPDEFRVMITDIYINGISQESYTEKLHYSRSSLKRTINNVLAELF